MMTSLPLPSRFAVAAIVFATLAALAATHAEAVQRTHVSAAIGSDNNTATSCTAAAPCRFFQAAMSVTDTNGEVVALDSGGYGAVTITKSVALISPTGVYAGISVFPGASGVTIATASVNAVLRGLTINGQGGNSGVKMTAGNKLTIENCIISNLTGYGVFVDTPATVRITDTTIRDTIGADISVGIGIAIQNGAKAVISRATVSGSSGTGLFVNGTSVIFFTKADVTGSTFDGNYNGIYAYTSVPNATSTVSVSDSLVVQNLNWGIIAQNAGGGYARLSAINNKVSNNYSGIGAYGPYASATANGNTVSDHAKYGLFNSNAIFGTFGNNAIYNYSSLPGDISVIRAQ